jgi:hypothetical protein
MQPKIVHDGELVGQGGGQKINDRLNTESWLYFVD